MPAGIRSRGRTPRGLANQGWKDSGDSVFHADGTLAEGPIALCEVQCYTYAAKSRAAEIALLLGREKQADRLMRESQMLQQRFEETFWCEEISTYALALDGKKRPCQVRTSNAGHALFTEIASRQRAERIAEGLLSEEFFSGWGVRTLAVSEVRYNPMSYHNGSIWPHDNALIAYGLSRYGLMDEVVQILTGLFDTSVFVDLHRLPELFCGFMRRPGEGPTLYPVACAPQAWATTSVFMLLQACLGISIDGRAGRICFSRGVLPAFLETVELRNLAVGEASVDLLLERHRHSVGINIMRREGDVEIVAVK